MASESMDTVFRALASGSRRRILDIVKAKPGCTVGYVASHFKVSRITVMKHLRLLEDAGLIHSERDGRSRRLYFDPVPIQLIYDRWTTEYSALWAAHLTRVKYRVESSRGTRRK